MNKFKNSSIIYILAFSLIIGLGAIVSAKKLVSFYVNDEADPNEWKADLGDKFETDIATNFVLKQEYVNVNGALNRLLGKREMNEVVKLNNGYLMEPFPYVDDDTLQGYVDSIVDFNKFLQDEDKKLIYALVPYVVSKFDPQLPVGIEDYGNDDLDRLMDKLNAAGIDTIDFREEMHNDEIDQYSLFFRTDHHWTMEGGLYAYGKIAEKIGEVTGCNLDNRVSDINNYDIERYPKWHLGSMGQRTGKYYAGIDDFDLLIPKFETKIQNGLGEVGDFRQMVINMELLEHKDYSSRYTYDRVLGKSGGTQFLNLNSVNDINVFLIGDSQSYAVDPFMIMGFSRITYGPVTYFFQLTPEYFEESESDVVVMLIYAGNAIIKDPYELKGVLY